VKTKAVAVEVVVEANVVVVEAVTAVAVVAVVAVEVVVETKVVVVVTVVSNANAMMKTKMMNPIVVRVPPPVQAAIGEAATALHLMLVHEKVEPDQYHAPQSCMLMLLSQMVAIRCLILKLENLKRT
jgi:hypothetical protein